MENSPFAPYLNTNYAPSEHEKNVLRQLLQGPREEIKAIDQELSNLQTRIRDLTARKDACSRFIDEHSPLLNPIRDLPLDILRTIFAYCLPDTPPALVIATEAPMGLTCVCRRWREVAVGFSSLWDQIALDFPPYEYDHSQNGWEPPLTHESLKDWDQLTEVRANLLNMWVSRAGGRLLSIHIASSPPVPSDGELTKGTKVMLDLVKERSRQWKSLHIARVADPLLNTILSIPASSVPNLRLLEMNQPWLSTSRLYRDPTLLLGAPSIRSLGFCGSNTLFLQSAFQFNGLTSLDTMRLSPALYDNEAWELLRRCPRLTDCRLRVISSQAFDRVDESAFTPISLPSLGRLELMHSQRTDRFLSSLQLPALTSLNILENDPECHTLSILVERCCDTLEYLYLQCLSGTTEGIVANLAHLTRLKSLELAYIPYRGPPVPIITDELLIALTPKQVSEGSQNSSTSSSDEAIPDASSRCLCPALEEIRFHVSIGPRLSDEVIISFIQRRRSLPVKALRSVTIVQPKYTQDLDVVAELERMQVDLHRVDINLQYRAPRVPGKTALDL